MWARIDVNANGYVSLAEITKVFYHRHHHHHHCHHHRCHVELKTHHHPLLLLIDLVILRLGVLVKLIHMFLFKLNPNQTISGSSGRAQGRTISWLICSDG